MKITRRQLRKIINETMYKGVPAEFPPDHKKRAGQAIRSNQDMMNLLSTGQMGFGERGMRHDPVIGDDGRPVGASMRNRTDQEMKSIRDLADSERASAEAERMQRQQARQAEEDRLSALSIDTLRDERQNFLSDLVKGETNTRYPYGRYRGDVDSVTPYRKRDDSTFTDQELQMLKDYDTLDARRHGAYAGLAGVTSTSLSSDRKTLNVRYKKHTAG